ncbi:MULTISPECIES: AAA family ATPase [Streptococcus]|uniref:AAA family ATPase n=1 Tax=Streptococcus TaxID=1301 RepID=UPI0015642C29|nr:MULTISPECIES: ATP-binding protein [Streptococcus]MCY7070513.1 ATP-binding protein [Streptococcus oralis]
MSAKLKTLILENFKSFDGRSNFFVEELTTIIGLNASGKSNVIEALSILSMVSRDILITNILNNTSTVALPIRGGAQGCLRGNKKTFGLGCTIEKENGSVLEYFIKFKVENSDRVFVDEESLFELHMKKHEDKSLIFKTIKSKNSIADINVEYDNKKRGKNPRMMMDRSRSILSQLDRNRIDTSTQLNNFYDFIESAKKSGKEININEFDEIKEISRSENTIFKEIEIVKEVLKSMFILNIDSNKIRSYTRRDNSRLTYDAGNLSAVLDRLYIDVKRYRKINPSSSMIVDRMTMSKRKWDSILDTISVIPEYKIVDLTITVTPLPYRDVIFTCTEQIEGKEVKIPATSLSDGTISVIAITTAVATYPENSIIVIDEFDNGIHHSKAIKFLEKIQRIAQKKNITLVLTTHNTTLLNSLQGRDYKGINIIYREQNTSNSSILRFVDLQNYEKVIATGGIGNAVAKDGLLSYIEQEEYEIELPSWLRGLE